MPETSENEGKPLLCPLQKGISLYAQARLCILEKWALGADWGRIYFLDVSAEAPDALSFIWVWKPSHWPDVFKAVIAKPRAPTGCQHPAESRTHAALPSIWAGVGGRAVPVYV